MNIYKHNETNTELDNTGKKLNKHRNAHTRINKCSINKKKETNK
jgi:hypothetical protein